MLTNLLQLFKIALTVRKTIVKFRISFTNKVKQRKKLLEIEKEFLVYLLCGFVFQKQMLLPVYRNVVSFATAQNFKSILIFYQIFWPNNNNDFTQFKTDIILIYVEYVK